MSTICEHGNYVGDEEGCGRCAREDISRRAAVERDRDRLAERVRVLEQVLEEYANHAEDSGWLNLAAEIRDRAAKR